MIPSYLDLKINLQQGYHVFVRSHLQEDSAFLEFCKSKATQLVLITDANISDYFGRSFYNSLKEKIPSSLFLEFPAGDFYKSRETKQSLEDQMFEAQCSRDTCLVALGGGVVSDLVGFLGATYCRGIPFIFIPTTLLAMVDASVGGKTAVNTPYGKNLVGAFSQPEAVFLDINLLKTLPEQEFDHGLAEILKYMLIGHEREFYTLCNQFEKLKSSSNRLKQEKSHWLKRDEDYLLHIILETIKIKKSLVEQDEYDQGMRQLANFGHTFGHALEILSDYTIPHGQAVAIGILLESHLSNSLGFLSDKEFQTILSSMQIFSFSLRSSLLKDKEKLWQTLSLDKKNKQKEVRFVLLNKIGKAYVSQDEKPIYCHSVSKEYIEKTLNWYYEDYFL